MNVLVTGAGGYLGRATVAALRAAGHTPVALLHSQAAELEDTATYVGDLTEPATLAEPLRGIDVVCHLAGLTRARESWEQLERYFQVNVCGTLNLLAAMLRADVRRIVFASTGAIYGSPPEQPMHEDLPDDIPHPYAASKRAAELAIESHADAGKIGAAIIRLFNVAGGHDPDETRMVPRALAAAAGQAPRFPVNGDGSAVRDLLHVDDAAAAFAAACAHTPPPGTWRRFNVGSGRGSSVLDLVAAAERVTGRHIEVEHRPAAAEPPALIADPSRAIAELGWKPTRSSLEQIVADAWSALERA